MAVRDGTVAGVPCRLFRVSFTGELGYEINVPADYGAAVWEALSSAGRRFGITPYGTEAMHVLRAEKGYIIVGQETDGTVTPDDLGLDWIVGKTKPDFVGKRSLARPDLVAPGRKQLVGLLTEDPSEVLEEGAQIVAAIRTRPIPMRMLGHVTSSYWSPNCGRSIALALVAGGRGRIGEPPPRDDAGRLTTVQVVRAGLLRSQGGARPCLRPSTRSPPSGAQRRAADRRPVRRRHRIRPLAGAGALLVPAWRMRRAARGRRPSPAFASTGRCSTGHAGRRASARSGSARTNGS